MKWHAGAATPGKRRWRGPPLLVPALVIFSLVLPLAFLLGLLNRFPYGYSVDDRPTSETAFGNYGQREDDGLGLAEDGHSKVQNLVQRLGTSLPKDGSESLLSQRSEDLNGKTVGATVDSRTKYNSQPKINSLQAQLKDILPQSGSQESSFYNGQEDAISQSQGLLPPQLAAASKPPPAPNATNFYETRRDGLTKNFTGDENGKSCQLEFGSYCLWSLEHKEVMMDAVVKRLKDQLFVARAYYPSIAKLTQQDILSRELKQNIQEHERMLSEAIVDADLPSNVEKKIQEMDQVIAKAKSCAVDCNNVDKKLRQILDLTEDEAHFHMKQSAFLYHLGVQTMPKSHHCLSMRLTVEYFKSPPMDVVQSYAPKLSNPQLRHHVMFSRNILAASVAINSTVMNSKDTGNMVFHLLTDAQNYYAMKLWFARNAYKEATIQVLNFDELILEHSPSYGTPLSPSEEYRVSIRSNDQPPPAQIRTEYLSVFGSSHFLIPQIFKHLTKVVLLDDDVVIQRDLSSLWNLDLEGRVIGAVEFCGVKLGQLKSYLRNTGDIGNSCAWMSGLNIVDLDMWRTRDVSGTYQHLHQKLFDMNEASQRAAALPTSLLAFRTMVYPLDASWAVSGLGHNYGVGPDAISNAAVLHYNGNMKPWLELGIPSYKKFWRKYLAKEEHFMDECNVSA